MINHSLLIEAWETLPTRLAYQSYWSPIRSLASWGGEAVCGVQHLHDVLTENHLCFEEHEYREIDLCVAEHYGLSYREVARIRIRNDGQKDRVRRYFVVKAALFELILKAEQEQAHATREAERIIAATGFFEVPLTHPR